MTRYVQHKSGQGEKWELVKEITDPPMWCVRGPNQPYVTYWYPKSEYLEVPAPEVWVDVTAQCEFTESKLRQELQHDDRPIAEFWVRAERYRLHKLAICTGSGIDHEATKQWAFIVQKKVQP